MNDKTYINKCTVCLDDFVSTSLRTKYCSDECGTTAYLKRCNAPKKDGQVCLQCDGPMPAKGGRKYCSLECRDKGTIAKRKMVQVTCEVCGKTVMKRFRSAMSKTQLCSRACIGENNRRRITGTRDESKHEAYSCKNCGKTGDRLKAGKNGKVREFCSRKCKGLFFASSVIPKLQASKSFIVQLNDDTTVIVKSRWEAAFIKDYLEVRGLKWSYEPQRFELANGKGYYPDFHIADDLWIEIKGCAYYDRFDKAKDFATQHPELNYIVADHDVLTNRFGLDLSQERLHEVCKSPGVV